MSCAKKDFIENKKTIIEKILIKNLINSSLLIYFIELIKVIFVSKAFYVKILILIS